MRYFRIKRFLPFGVIIPGRKKRDASPGKERNLVISAFGFVKPGGDEDDALRDFAEKRRRQIARIAASRLNLLCSLISLISLIISQGA